jgi:hypothetical protein
VLLITDARPFAWAPARARSRISARFRVRHSPEPDIDRHTGATIAEAVENPKNIGP